VTKIGLSWGVGSPTLTDNSNGTHTLELTGDQFTYARTANDLIAPFTSDIDLTIQPVTDSDSVSGSGLPKIFSPIGSQVRFGRAVATNAHGSELRALNVPLEVHQYNGLTNGFSLNTSDTCSQVLALSLSDLDSTDGLVATDTPSRNTAIYAPASVAAGFAASDLSDAGLLFTQPAINGLFNLNLQPPGQGNAGSAQANIVVPDWLKYWWSGGIPTDPTAKATFGIHNRPSAVIYQREM